MEPGEKSVYVINLSRVYYGRSTNRAKRAVDLIRRFVSRHAKVPTDSVVILNDVNNFVWSRGIKRPPRRVKVLVTLVSGEEGNRAIVSLARNKLPPGRLSKGLNYYPRWNGLVTLGRTGKPELSGQGLMSRQLPHLTCA